jgi:hypothetical protein
MQSTATLPAPAPEPATPAEHDYITAQQAVALCPFKLSSKTLVRWSRDGNGPPLIELATPHRPRIRFRRSDITSFFAKLVSGEGANHGA